MRKRWARWLAAVTGALVIAVSAGFALIQNPGVAAPAAGSLPQGLAAAPTEDAERLAAGRKVYDQQGCASCHAIAGEGSPRSPLDGVGSTLDATQIRHYVTGDPAIADDLAPRVLAAKRAYAELPPEQLDALLAYLASLR
jgi:mono/diheme cytochrome c family protein